MLDIHVYIYVWRGVGALFAHAEFKLRGGGLIGFCVSCCSRIIEHQEDQSAKTHFEEWVYNSNFTARNLRIEAQYVGRYALEVAGAFFDGWKTRVKLQVHPLPAGASFAQ